ncbi:MAG TPA: ABC transporter ATP-binding protein [Spirochaetaceae bacterium]|nr:ABC transporter ATP-binding protein [Spirochaetaceae bacterium]
MNNNESVIEALNISVSYISDAVKTTVLDNFSLSLCAGEVVALVGESGSGKSSAIMAMLGLLPGNASVSGTIRFHGRVFPAGNEAAFHELRGRGAGLVIQEPMASLNPLMKVGVQVMEALDLRSDASRIDKEAKLRDLLSEVGLKDERRITSSYPHQLSGGQIQRIMIGMALAQDPGILIADEPTTALDLTVQRKIINLLMDLRRKRRMAMIVVSHDLSLVSHISDRIIIMRHGKIVESGATKSVISRPSSNYTKTLLESKPGAHAPGTLIPVREDGDSARAERGGIVNGGRIEHRISDDVILRFNDVDVYYRKGFLSVPFRALDGVSLSLRRGETLGVVGESGSGKSTLGKLAIGIVRATRGCVELNGRVVMHADGVRIHETLPSCQMVFQNSSGALNRGLRVGRLLEEPYRVLLGMSASLARKSVIDALEEVGLAPEIAGRFPHQLSGGQRQRVNIARALAGKPSILICDEAVSALDSTVQAGILNLLLRIRASRGLSMIFISHDMDVIRHVSDRIAVMERGRIVEENSANEIFLNPIHPVTINLINSMFRTKDTESFLSVQPLQAVPTLA